MTACADSISHWEVWSWAAVEKETGSLTGGPIQLGGFYRLQMMNCFMVGWWGWWASSTCCHVHAMHGMKISILLIACQPGTVALQLASVSFTTSG